MRSTISPLFLYRLAIAALLVALALVAGLCRLRWEQQQWKIEELQQRLFHQARQHDRGPAR